MMFRRALAGGLLLSAIPFGIAAGDMICNVDASNCPAECTVTTDPCGFSCPADQIMECTAEVTVTHDEPDPPPATMGDVDAVLVLGFANADEIGHNWTIANKTVDVILYEIDLGQTPPAAAWLQVTGWDIDYSDEAKVSVNGTDVGHLEKGPNNQRAPSNSFDVASLLVAGINQIRVHQDRGAGNTNPIWAFGATDVAVVTTDPNPAPPPPAGLVSGTTLAELAANMQPGEWGLIAGSEQAYDATTWSLSEFRLFWGVPAEVDDATLRGHTKPELHQGRRAEGVALDAAKRRRMVPRPLERRTPRQRRQSGDALVCVS